jgi:hypothetical protein
MKRNCKAAMWTVLLSIVWIAAGWGQEVSLLPEWGEYLTVEGELTYIQTKGPAILELKAAGGRKYRIQLPLGAMAALRHEGFNPTAGERIGATGEVVCVLGETVVIAGREVTSNGKTYRMPRGPS